MLNICAVIAIHNNPHTISRVLEHYKKNEIEVVVIDDGSTDETIEIIRKYIHAPVTRIHTLEFDGTFNLNKILELKKHIISSLDADWFIHADADEIFESPVEGESLRDFIERQSFQGVDVIDCDEFVFVPENENANYSPENFVEKMNRYYHFDKPGRTLHRFIRLAPGAIEWGGSGGHRINITNRILATERIRLRHYIGLSLDHLRAQYYSRVFSSQGLLNQWHGNRIALTPEFIQAPDSKRLFRLDKDGWRTDRPESEHLIFNQQILKKKKKKFNLVQSAKNKVHVVFIVGVECSGTELLKFFLENWPSCSCISNTDWLKLFLQQFISHDKNGKVNNAVFTAHSSWAKLGIDSNITEAFYNSERDVNPAEFLDKILDHYKKKNGGEIYCDITPQHSNLIYDIAQVLPEARFIHLIRDGRDVAACTRKPSWGKKRNIRELAINWTWNIRDARQQAQFVPHYLEVRYEALVENPEHTLKQIADFIEIPLFQPQMIKYFEGGKVTETAELFDDYEFLNPESKHRANDSRYTLPVNDLVGRYQKELSNSHVIKFEGIAGSLLCDLGYKNNQEKIVAKPKNVQIYGDLENLKSRIKTKSFVSYILAANKKNLEKLHHIFLNTKHHVKDFLPGTNLNTQLDNAARKTNSWPYTISEGELLSRVRNYNKQKPLRKAKVICYSIINDRSDYVIIPETIVDEWDYAVFSNRAIEGDHIFDVYPPLLNHANHLLSVNYLKTHPHILFPQYEYSVWLDPGILVRGSHLQVTIESCVHNESLVMLNVHSNFGTMQQRLEKCLQSLGSSKDILKKQILKYYEEGLPENVLFYNTGVVIRHHMSPEVIEMNEAWWKEILEGIKSDQLSLPYIIWKFKLSVGLMNWKPGPHTLGSCDYSLFQDKYSNLRNVPEFRMPNFLRIIPKPQDAEIDNEKAKLKDPKLSGIDFLGITKKLYRYGFVDRALSDLLDVIKKSDNQILKQKVARELAMWYAGQHTNDDTMTCLKYIEMVSPHKTRQSIHNAAILKAECYNKIGKSKEAEEVIMDGLQSGPSLDLFIAMAYLSKSVDQIIFWLNKVYDLYSISHITLSGEYKFTGFRRLNVDFAADNNYVSNAGDAKITIIVTAYNSADSIHPALSSIINQTWKNLEIIVVDDCSTDNTISVIESFKQKDSRIKLIRLRQNQGTYVARNHALRAATGEFVTCHDADDWSHPEKIAVQARHLQQHQSILANTSEFIRVTDDLTPYRKPNAGQFVKINYSSLMFRRKEVMEALGYWDPVRFGADSEMVFRMKKHFGSESVEHLKTGPLMFALQSEYTLTGNQKFGIHGYLNGARADYQDSFLDYMERDGDLYYPFPMTKRKFAVPEPLKPDAELRQEVKRHFDTVIVFDFRLEGGITDSIITEVSGGLLKGEKIGLVQMCIYDVPDKEFPKICSSIRQLINDEKAQLIVYGEQVNCDLVIVKHPAVLMDYQLFVPEIEAGELIVELCPTISLKVDPAFFSYEKKVCENNLQRYFHNPGKWINDKSHGYD